MADPSFPLDVPPLKMGVGFVDGLLGDGGRLWDPPIDLPRPQHHPTKGTWSTIDHRVHKGRKIGRFAINSMATGQLLRELDQEKFIKYF